MGLWLLQLGRQNGSSEVLNYTETVTQSNDERPLEIALKSPRRSSGGRSSVNRDPNALRSSVTQVRFSPKWQQIRGN